HAGAVLPLGRDQYTARRPSNGVHAVIRNVLGLDKRPSYCQSIRVSRYCEVRPSAHSRSSSISAHDEACLELSELTVLTKAHARRTARRHHLDSHASPNFCSCFCGHAYQRFLHVGVIEVERTDLMRRRLHQVPSAKRRGTLI